MLIDTIAHPFLWINVHSSEPGIKTKLLGSKWIPYKQYPLKQLLNQYFIILCFKMYWEFFLKILLGWSGRNPQGRWQSLWEPLHLESPLELRGLAGGCREDALLEQGVHRISGGYFLLKYVKRVYNFFSMEKATVF